MYTSGKDQGPSIIKMDPDCAICSAPAQAACDCEAKGLDMAIKQTESRVMGPIYAQIRSWVRGHAQDYVLEYFRLLADRRKEAHSNHMDELHSHAWYRYKAPPHPQQVHEAQEELKRGIDEDWRTSVERYPEVLEYFFNLVELSLPPDDDADIQDPQALNAPTSSRKQGRRAIGGVPSRRDGLPPPPLAMPSFANLMNGMPPRTAPLPERQERRQPREKGRSRHSMPPQHAPYIQNPHAPYM